jgi:hypothetical protein
MKKQEINRLLDERDSILGKNYNDPRADEIENQIMSVLMNSFDKFEVDFILETLIRFGKSPNVIYDDNGLFAVTGCGFQPVVTGKQKIEGAITVFVEKKQWKKTVREALRHYMFK